MSPAGMTPAIDLPGASGALRELAARGVRHTYKKGRLLIEEGDLGDTIYIVLGGRLRVYAVNAANGREITYGTYGPGEYVGEMSLDGGPRSANVETLEPSECALVTRPTLQAFIAERPDFAFELLAKLIRRARAATLSARDMALNDVYGRLRLLLEARAVAGDGGPLRRISPRPTHQAMARELGCSREMVSRLMKDLERGGYLVARPDALEFAGPLPLRW